MIKVIIPMVALLLVVFLKKLPGNGGNVKFALFLAGALTLLLNGIFDLEVWLDAFIDGLNRLAWIIALSIAGSLFAEVSNQIGAIDTIVGALNAKFGKRPRILVVCVIFALTVAGSLLGDAIAAATVIGVLSVGLLISMNLSGEKISAIIIMGAVTGSIMPPMTQALALGSSLVGADPDTVINMGYITITIVFAVVSIYVATFLVKKDNFLGANKSIEVKYADKSAGEILRKNWKSLLPMFFLILVIVLRTIPVPAISIDLGPAVLSQFQFISLSSGETQTLYEWLSNMTIINGITNGVVISILCALLFSFIFPKVRNNGKEIVREGFNKVKSTVLLQVCCAFMLGCFYSAGSIDTVAAFCQDLNPNVLKIGGLVAMMLIGMLTGSQSTTQNVVFSFFGPALVASGLSNVSAALVGAHAATAAQALPGANMTGYVVVGIVAGQLGKKVDPIKAMLYCLPMVIALTGIAIFFLY